ncbi:MAG: F0F1 ATP synthase subunit B [Hyphomicrobium sp.]|nr:F0F1 ATP synthase subunit B [Hyphomicrobium sp.]
MLDPTSTTFWVLISFSLFVAMLMYYGVPAVIGKALDARADGIRKELDDARKLREDAQALLADYTNKAREAENEARSIIENAKREAEALASESRKALAESLERRSKLAEDKIARAEAQAVSEVRAAAVGSAMLAAEKLLKARVPGATGDALINEAIAGLKGKLN